MLLLHHSLVMDQILLELILLLANLKSQHTKTALSITESQISDLGDYATVSYVNSEVAGIVSASPRSALDTLNELGPQH